MSQHVPCGEFEWVEEELTEEFIDTAEYGYILEVDLEYPSELHDLHNDYPLAPERITVQENMLSEYAKSSLGTAKYSTVPKLILNLHNKKKLHSSLWKP